MCGILIWVDHSKRTTDNDAFGTVAPSWLIRRGPDHQASFSLDRTTTVVGHASVLGMRDKFTAQPVPLFPSLDNNHENLEARSDAQQCYLCWNGEVYESQKASDDENGDDADDDDDAPGGPTVSDTEFVANLLRRVLTKQDSFMVDIAAVLAQLVNAEFAMCVATPNHIYYAKDPWGRRSLLTGTSNNNGEVSSPCWSLASVANASDMEWTEVPAGILFTYNVHDGTTQPVAYHQARPSLARNTSLTITSDPSETLYQVLRDAVHRRIHGKQGVAVLFSGGLDSVVLAALVLQEQAHVTLANVSFVTNDTETFVEASSAADTRAAVASYQELVQLFPDAKIDFAPRQVTWHEVQQERGRLERLIYPKTTVMDLNIATAFWFAADTCVKNRILLTGLGADEQMGGYGRHRKAWEKGGNAALEVELQMDQERLWERNLGRDDRVLSDTSKEARYPYLDTAVVQFLATQNLDHVCDFNLPPGQGDKRILRQVAERMGLTCASVAVKRAIQFGSKIAHVSDKKLFGSRRKASGEAQFGKSTNCSKKG